MSLYVAYHGFEPPKQSKKEGKMPAKKKKTTVAKRTVKKKATKRKKTRKPKTFLARLFGG